MYQIAASILKNVVVILLSQMAYASIERAMKRKRAKAASTRESTARV